MRKKWPLRFFLMGVATLVVGFGLLVLTPILSPAWHDVATKTGAGLVIVGPLVAGALAVIVSFLKA